MIIKNMADQLYRNVAGLSQSAIKNLSKSPAHFLYAQENPPAASPAMFLGRLFHHLVLTPQEPQWWAVKPDGMSFATKEGKAWREAASGIIVTAEQWDAAKGMASAVLAHPNLPAFTDTELSIVDTRLAPAESLLKGRLDAVAGGDIYDLKSCEDARPEAFARTIHAYSYHVQAALYLDLYNAHVNCEQDAARGFYFVAVESAAPHGCRMYRLSDDAVEQGRAEYRRLLRLHDECVRQDLWPAYTDECVELSLPIWARSSKEAE